MTQINFSVRNCCKSQQLARYHQLGRGGDESQNLFETSECRPQTREREQLWKRNYFITNLTNIFY